VKAWIGQRIAEVVSHKPAAKLTADLRAAEEND